MVLPLAASSLVRMDMNVEPHPAFRFGICVRTPDGRSDCVRFPRIDLARKQSVAIQRAAVLSQASRLPTEKLSQLKQAKRVSLLLCRPVGYRLVQFHA